jgi:hypothetical protein
VCTRIDPLRVTIERQDRRSGLTSDTVKIDTGSPRLHKLKGVDRIEKHMESSRQPSDSLRFRPLREPLDEFPLTLIEIRSSTYFPDSC